jgi:hypothetical protein
LEFLCVVELALLNCEAMSMVKLQANVYDIYCIFLLIYHNDSPVVSNFCCPEFGSFLSVPKSFFVSRNSVLCW